jgi:hypothetical protein
MKLLLGLLLALSLPGATLVRIQCGGPGGIDSQGNVWQADTGFTGGARWDSSNQASMAALAPPYNTLRYSAYPAGAPFSYVIATLPPTTTAGHYTVTLRFVEPNKTAVGQRVFSVSANGTPLVTNLDLFAVAPIPGALTPYTVSFPVVITGSSLQLVFTPSVGNAVISGIQVDDDTVAPSVPTYVTGLESAAPICPATGLTFFYATDTDHLFRCWAGGEWKVVGDVRNAPVASLRECSGSGPGWNCAGLLWATIPMQDGSLVQLMGAAMPDYQPGTGTTWTDKQ